MSPTQSPANSFTPADAAKLKPLALPVVPRRRAAPTTVSTLLSPESREALANLRASLSSADAAAPTPR